MTVTAIYEDGVVKPKEPVNLEDHAEVELEIRSLTPPAEDDDPTGWKAIDEMMGFLEEGPRGPIGEEHDKYLYRK